MANSVSWELEGKKIRGGGKVALKAKKRKKGSTKWHSSKKGKALHKGGK